MIFENIANLRPWVWVAILALSALLRLLSFRYQKGLSKYPGPFLASFTNFWRLWQPLYHWDRVTYPDVLRYGKVIRLGPNTLLFSEPDAIRDIYTTGFSKASNPPGPSTQRQAASNQYRVAAGVSKGHVVVNLFSTTDKEWHAKLRRSVSNAFALSTLIQYEPLVTRTLTTFLRVAHRDYADKKGEVGIFDFAEYSKYIALDVISELTFGTPYGLLEAGEDSIGIIKGRTGLLRYFHVCYNVSWVDDLLYKNPILLWLGRMGWYNKVTSTVPFAQDQISARHASPRNKTQRGDKDDLERRETGPADLLTKFLKAKAESPNVVDDRAVLGLTLSMVNAGSGTVATSLAAIIYYLHRDPVTLGKLMAELDAHFPPPTSSVESSFEDWVVPFNEAQKLPYLDACFKETFRIHPALGGQLLERITPPGGAVIAGEHVPGNIIVSSNAWIVHRHKPTFGDDVEVFRPERWIDCDGKQLAAMNRSLLHFGAGPNTCIGKSIGLLELYKMVPTILRMFNVEPVSSHTPWKIYNLGDPEPYEFYVRITSRRR